jgi:hypothetical protein
MLQSGSLPDFNSNSFVIAFVDAKAFAMRVPMTCFYFRKRLEARCEVELSAIQASDLPI